MIISGWLFLPYIAYHARSISSNTRLPPIRNPLLRLPATQLAAMIRTQRCSSEQVIAAYVARCRAVNPFLNAIVDERFDAALDDARAIDALIASGQCSVAQMAADTPLLGLPLSVKESIAVRGLSHQAGRRLTRPHRAKADAPSVHRARQAGAIVLLVSNTPELCMCWETYNLVTGLTRNPYDLRRSAGGSSGGEAALLAAGASLLGLCSDIAGSARLPAAFCGVFGHKPTPYAVSPDGHIPKACTPEWGDYFTVAPMTRYAADLALLLRCVADPQRSDVLDMRRIAVDGADADVALRVFYMPDDGPAGSSCPVEPAVRRAVEAVAHLLGGRRTHIAELQYALEVSMSAMLRLPRVETIYADRGGNGDRPVRTLLGETVRYALGWSDSTFPAVVVGHLQALVRALPAGGHRRMAAIAKRLKERFAAMLGEDGVFLYPTFPSTAHRHYEIYHKLVEPSYMMVFNTIGLPVTNCMVGFDERGMPIGIQVSGIKAACGYSIRIKCRVVS